MIDSNLVKFVIKTSGSTGMVFLLHIYLMPMILEHEGFKNLSSNGELAIRTMASIIVFIVSLLLINTVIPKKITNHKQPNSLNIEKSTVHGDVVNGNKTTNEYRS